METSSKHGGGSHRVFGVSYSLLSKVSSAKQ